MELKVKENLKLKETVENEKELWKNKANNLKRNSSNSRENLSHIYKHSLSSNTEIINENELNNLVTSKSEKFSHNLNEENLKSIECSDISENDDFSKDKKNYRVDFKKINNRNIIVSDINSDIDNLSQK